MTIAPKRNSWFSLVCLGLLGSAALLPARATANEAATCPAGVELHLSAPESSQGSLLLAQLKSTKPLAGLSADWGDRTIPFWQERGNSGDERALLGVDLEKAPGKYELKVTGQAAGGEKLVCTVMIEVIEGRFATEKLHVEKEYVEPSPEQVQRANEERQKLRDIFDRVTAERLWKGKFRVPLDGVSTGGNFGKRRVLNGQPGSPHGGVDFPALTGTSVHAAQSGRVALAEELFFSGNTVVIDHGLGIYTFYGHLSEIDVKVGDALASGQVLGKVGATGRVTGPHLHWGLTVEGARVNPLDIVKLLDRE